MSVFTSLYTRPNSPFEPPSFFYRIFTHPITTFFSFFHHVALFLRGAPYKPPSNQLPIRVVCISDTHSKIPPRSLPPGDLLIHAGDLTNLGTVSEIQRTIDWLKSLLKIWPGSSDGYRYIVSICGNHDSYFDERSRSAHDKKFSKRAPDWGKIIYLQHDSISLTFPENRTIKIYGTPQIPACGGKEFAFQYARGQDAWSNTIPDDVDLLVTHNPPKWHLDIPENGGLGCENELKEVWRVKPTLHVFGHVHAGHGTEKVWWDEGQRQFEKLRERGFGPRTFGPFSELVDLGLWAIGFKMFYEDVRGLLWTRLWGGQRNGGFMVNAALTYKSTDRLLNRPQVVVL